MVGIVACGTYIPRLRLERAAVAAGHAWFAPGLKSLGRGTRAIAAWDEDSVTMALEAARGAGAGQDTGLDAIYLASLSLPFRDRQNAGLVKEALALDDAIATVDFTGSQRAGTSALATALRAAGNGRVLCIASEKSRPQPGSESELTSGDAAAAFIVGAGPVIAELVAATTISTDFVDHFTGADAEFAYGWEQRWVRDEGFGKIVPRAIEAALSRAGLTGADIAHFAFAPAARGLAASLAKRVGIPSEAVQDGLNGMVGDTGLVQPLLALALALETAQPGQHILAAGFGQGCDVLIFRTTAALAETRPVASVSAQCARGLATANYLQYLSLNGLLDIDRGMRAEQDQKTPLTALYRDRAAVMGLIGGRCTKTGTVQFPKSDISVNPNDPAFGTQEDYRFANRAARVVTFTVDRLAYTPSPPYFYGTIAFEGGGRMVAEFTDCAEGDIAVGKPVRMVFRIKTHDERRHFTRYFWKAVPTDR